MESNINITELEGSSSAPQEIENSSKPQLIVESVQYENLPIEVREHLEKLADNLSPCQKAALENKPCPEQPKPVNNNPYIVTDADGSQWVINERTGEKTRIGNVSPNDTVKPVSKKKNGFWARLKRRIVKVLAWILSPIFKQIYGKQAEESLVLKRLRRCIDCEFHTYVAEEGLSKCGKCLCILNTKVSAENSNCPMGKWNFDDISEK